MAKKKKISNTAKGAGIGGAAGVAGGLVKGGSIGIAAGGKAIGVPTVIALGVTGIGVGVLAVGALYGAHKLYKELNKKS